MLRHPVSLLPRSLWLPSGTAAPEGHSWFLCFPKVLHCKAVTRSSAWGAPLKDYWFLVLFLYFAPGLRENTLIAFDFVFIHKINWVSAVLWSQCRHIRSNLLVCHLFSQSCNCCSTLSLAGCESAACTSGEVLGEWLAVGNCCWGLAVSGEDVQARHSSSSDGAAEVQQACSPTKSMFSCCGKLLCCFSFLLPYPLP